MVGCGATHRGDGLLEMLAWDRGRRGVATEHGRFDPRSLGRVEMCTCSPPRPGAVTAGFRNGYPAPPVFSSLADSPRPAAPFTEIVRSSGSQGARLGLRVEARIGWSEWLSTDDRVVQSSNSSNCSPVTPSSRRSSSISRTHWVSGTALRISAEMPATAAWITAPDRSRDPLVAGGRGL